MSENDRLTKVIVDLAIFFEYADDDAVDPDAAVEAMEQLAAGLQQMSEEEQRKTADRMIALAPSYSSPHREFVEGLPEALGIV